jgi:N-acetylglutamate synthase-like GNAT family acetyltransferase
MNIVLLAEHPERIGELARLHQPQWQAAHPGWCISDWEKEFHRHAHSQDQRRSLPCTLLALDENGMLLGSASLVEDDMNGTVALSPWLANVLVLPAARGQGVGAALMTAIEDRASAQGHRTLYLFTEDQQALYERRGWQRREERLFEGKAVSLMQLALPSPSLKNHV